MQWLVYHMHIYQAIVITAIILIVIIIVCVDKEDMDPRKMQAQALCKENHK